jgi:hypothetical protein
MFSVKTHYWPHGDEDRNLVDEAAYQKRQSELIKVPLKDNKNALLLIYILFRNPSRVGQSQSMQVQFVDKINSSCFGNLMNLYSSIPKSIRLY